MKTILFLILLISIIESENLTGQWTWQNPLPQGNPLQYVTFISDSVGFAVGNMETILKTIDKGTSWHSCEFISNEPYTTLFSIFFCDNNIGWITGGVWKEIGSQAMV